MARVSRRSAVAGTVSGLAVAAAVVAVTAHVSGSVAAGPQDDGVSYGGYVGDLSENPNLEEQLLSGQDPATIPGVRAGSPTRSSIASTEENEKRLARENYDAGVTYEQDSADLPPR